MTTNDQALAAVEEILPQYIDKEDVFISDLLLKRGITDPNGRIAAYVEAALVKKNRVRRVAEGGVVVFI